MTKLKRCLLGTGLSAPLACTNGRAPQVARPGVFKRFVVALKAILALGAALLWAAAWAQPPASPPP